MYVTSVNVVKWYLHGSDKYVCMQVCTRVRAVHIIILHSKNSLRQSDKGPTK